MRRSMLSIAAAVLAACVALPGLALADAAPTFTLAPQAIHIDALFDGTTLAVQGEAPAGSDVVVRILGAAKDQHLKQKGKALGLLWMNLNTLSFKDVPGVYLVATSRPFEAMGPAAEAYRSTGVLREVAVEPAAADTAEIRAEFAKLKRSEGLYREAPGSVAVQPAADGREGFAATMAIPSRLSPGSYVVEVAALRDGAVVGSTRDAITVDLVGAPSMLANMAFGHAAVYGILATLIAIVAGLGIGLVFQSKGAH